MLGIKEIQEIIPHRHPFLLVDCIEAVSYTHLDVYKRQPGVQRCLSGKLAENIDDRYVD